jgi:hypothetical protein
MDSHARIIIFKRLIEPTGKIKNGSFWYNPITKGISIYICGKWILLTSPSIGDSSPPTLNAVIQNPLNYPGILSCEKIFSKYTAKYIKYNQHM